jgi:hypothetical protein
MLRKGQVATEFIMIIGFLFLFLVIFSAGLLSRYEDLRDDKEYIIVRDIGYKIKDEISLAYEVQPVYMRNFTLPLNVEGVNYSLDVTGTVVQVWTDNHEFSIRVSQVMGCIHKGNNSVTKHLNGSIGFECI